MFDYEDNRSKDENWIPFTLRIKTPEREYTIQEESKATMTEAELEYLTAGIDKQLTQLSEKKPAKFCFCNCEFNFEIIFCNIPEDDLVEIEIWINVGVRTNGLCFGYDEGIRFTANEEQLLRFVQELRYSIKSIIDNENQDDVETANIKRP